MSEQVSLSFVCSKQDEDTFHGDPDWHETCIVIKRCIVCGENAIAGYWCETCGHEDVGEPIHNCARKNDV